MLSVFNGQTMNAPPRNPRHGQRTSMKQNWGTKRQTDNDRHSCRPPPLSIPHPPSVLFAFDPGLSPVVPRFPSHGCNSPCSYSTLDVDCVLSCRLPLIRRGKPAFHTVSLVSILLDMRRCFELATPIFRPLLALLSLQELIDWMPTLLSRVCDERDGIAWPVWRIQGRLLSGGYLRL
ncbi:hypothetical protein K440DRAFT_322983 [Wilcoxina mikolae CBS 423.85]|nr:hypothetical protein K440DRAFT_322983 [Wilcoxina mikolae CBS 423.85]